jgi:hypothetical protein
MLLASALFQHGQPPMLQGLSYDAAISIHDMKKGVYKMCRFSPLDLFVEADLLKSACGKAGFSKSCLGQTVVAMIVA